MGKSLGSRRLPRREQEIAACLAEQLPDKAIPRRLHIAVCTVHAHLVRLHPKLGVHTRAQAVSKLLRESLV
jgi:DNA-binding NarL/FixJ family response regulator